MRLHRRGVVHRDHEARQHPLAGEIWCGKLLDFRAGQADGERRRRQPRQEEKALLRQNP